MSQLSEYCLNDSFGHSLKQQVNSYQQNSGLKQFHQILRRFFFFEKLTLFFSNKMKFSRLKKHCRKLIRKVSELSLSFSKLLTSVLIYCLYLIGLSKNKCSFKKLWTGDCSGHESQWCNIQSKFSLLQMQNFSTSSWLRNRLIIWSIDFTFWWYMVGTPHPILKGSITLKRGRG